MISKILFLVVASLTYSLIAIVTLLRHRYNGIGDVGGVGSPYVNTSR
jgi:hypothetical protein